jgi:fucose 4-O-acetylase-like acetyltransferase
MSTPTAVPRSPAIDTLRIAFMCLVVAGHTWTQPWLHVYLWTWGIPTYFALTGYLWSGRRTLTEEAKVRGRTLGIPYFSWFIILAAIAWPIHAIKDHWTLSNYLGDVWGGQFMDTPFWAFWYLGALFSSAVIYGAMRKLSMPWKWAIALALAAAAVYLPGQPARFLPFGLGLGLPALPFLAAGEQLKLLRPRLRRPLLVALAALAAGVGMIALVPRSYIDFKALYFGTPIVSALAAALVGLGIILGVVTLFERSPVSARTSALVTRVALASMVVMFVHVPILWALGGLVDGTPLDYVIAVVASFTIGLLLLAVPGSWFLTGVGGPATSSPAFLRGPTAVRAVVKTD